MSLATTPYGRPVRITDVRLAGPAAFRLLEMGLIRGAEVEVLRAAPLGDPLHVRVGDYDLSIRAQDADLVDVAAA